MNGRWKSSLLLCLLLAFYGCGGGGGSTPPATDPASPPPVAPPPDPPPSDPPPPGPPPPVSFKLTNENAVSAISFVMSGVEQVDESGRRMTAAANFLARSNWTVIDAKCISAPSVFISMSYDDNDSSAALSIGDVIRLRNSQPCDGVTRDVTMTITALGAPADFASSSQFFESLEGTVEFDVELDTGFRIQGTAELLYSAEALNQHWLFTEAAFTTTSGGTTQTFALEGVDKTLEDASGYTFSFSGSVDSEELGGEFSFASSVPFSGAIYHFPTAGELLLNAADSTIRLARSGDPALIADHAEYQVDEDGSGQYADANQIPWVTFLYGTLFDWIPNDAPEITSLTIGPADADTTVDLLASWNVEDPEGLPTSQSFEWRRNGAVIAGQTAAWLPADMHQKGDVIEVTMTASDGRATDVATASTTIANALPLVQGAILSPSDPRTTDELVFAATATDGDGDTLAITYAWRRNGEIIFGQSGPTLPASEHTRYDAITARIIVSDGTSEVTTDLSVTIHDAPPVVTVASFPGAVNYGDLLTFNATVSDPDGDPVAPFEFELTHGPAGMTIDPLTGLGSWVASDLLMFDRTIDVSWGVTINDSAADAGTGTVRVDDPGRAYALLRTGIEIPLWPAGLTVGDLDDDGDEEMLILSNRALFELQWDGAGGYRQTWAYPFAFTDFEDPYATPDSTALATGDVDGDGHYEIFLATSERIVKLDGAERRPVGEVEIGTDVSCSDLQYADLEGDGDGELVCLTGTNDSLDPRTLIVLSADDLSIRWQFPAAGYGSSIAIGNVDDDAALEIVTAAGYVFDGATFANEWVYGPGFGFDVDTGDLYGDGVEEIVAAVDWTAVRVYSASPLVKGTLWEIGDSGDLASLLAEDIDGDGTAEIIVGDGQWGNITAYEAAGNAAAVVFQISSQGAGVTAMGVGDVDGDGGLEFIWGTGASSSGEDQLVIAGRNPDEVEWTNIDPSQLDGPFVGGELAGSPLHDPAPLFMTARTDSGYAGSRLISMDPHSGDLTIGADFASNWTGVGALTVSDYNDDGTDEAFIATADSYTGYLMVHDFFAPDNTLWTSPNAPTQYGYGVAVTKADVTGDDNDELISITASGIVQVYDVYNSALVWQSAAMDSGLDVLVADLDGDGTQEIIAVTPYSVFVYARAPDPDVYQQQAVYYPLWSRMRDAVVGDTDGDGEVELIVLVGGVNPIDESSQVQRLDQNLQVLGSFEIDWRAEMVAIEASSSPKKNLLIPTAYPNGGTSRIVAVDARSGREVWRSPLLHSQVSPNSLHYVDVAGQLRISVGTAEGMYLTQ